MLINSVEFLSAVKIIARGSYNFQERMFVIFSSHDLNDNFFDNFCVYPEIDKFKTFINNNITFNSLLSSNHISNLLQKLAKLELQKLGISTKYVGFEYLANIISNAFSKHFYHTEYIDLFECVAIKLGVNIDTMERSVRHMLSATWKTNEKFRQALKSSYDLSKVNSKNILNAVLAYMKKVI